MDNWNRLTANMILYCKKWEKTVHFYKEELFLPVNFKNDWFVEFNLNHAARLSIADEQKASIKSSEKKGVTIALQVEDIEMVRKTLAKKKLNPTKISDHPWGAKVFYLYDPEGHRIEIWQLI